MQHAEYLRHDATALAELVRRREVSADELLDLALAQLARVQPRINAVVRTMEREARAQIAAGLTGPLAGVPFLLKDGLQDYAGVPTGVGSRALQHIVPREHAATTRRLLQAGLVVFGKTNLPELGLKGVSDSQFHGPVGNPWDPSRNAGGSSGGAAAAVAAGGAADGRGQRWWRLAAHSGVVLRAVHAQALAWAHLRSAGLRRGLVRRLHAWRAVAQRARLCPGAGRAGRGGAWRSVRRQPTAGVLVAGVPAARHGDCASGFSAASPIGTPVHPRRGGGGRRGGDAAAGAWATNVVPAAPDIDGPAMARSYLAMYLGQVAAEVALAQRAGARWRHFELLTRAMDVLGRATSAATLSTELLRWNDFARALGRFHLQHDLLLTPSMAGPPLRQGETDLPPWQAAVLEGVVSSGLLGLLARAGVVGGIVDGIARANLAPVPFTQLSNLTGTPAMSVPLHHTADGLPLGVQFIGRMGDEATLLQLASQLEQAAPWFDRLPGMAKT